MSLIIINPNSADVENKKKFLKRHLFLAAAVLLLCIFLFIKTRLDQTDIDPLPFIFSIAAGVLALASAFINKPLNKLFTLLIMFFMPIASFLLLENMTHDVITLGIGAVILSVLIYWVIYFLLFFIIGHMSAAYIIATVLVAFIGLFNYFVLSFRSSPILPWDIRSFGTAMSVSSNYSYDLTWRVLASLLGMLFLCVLAAKCSAKTTSKARIGCAIAAAFFGVCLGKFIQTDICYDIFDLYDIPFTESVNCKYDGFAVNFLMSCKYMNISVPDGYSPEAAAEILSQYESTSTESIDSDQSPQNIIVIMDEAFSDLSVLGDLQTSEEIMPFYDSLIGSENTVTGHMYASVLGGNTANTEFEFLTGSSMAFLPTGSIPFQQFISGEMPSLACALSDSGYNSTAMHPYSASGWNRETVYPLLGFERMIFRNDFTTYGNVRIYMSDSADFEMIENVTNDQQNNFVFNVTMQNHGSYFRTYANFTPDIEIFGQPIGTYPKAETYLSLIHMTDEALEEIIDYYSNSEENTVIVFFGDHQPTLLEDTFYKELCGKSVTQLTDEESANRYIVPFLIWTNYDMNADYSGKEDVTISANYLAKYVLEAAGANLNANTSDTDEGIEDTALYDAWLNFLSDVQEEYPVLTGNFYYDTGGEFHLINGSSASDNSQDLPEILQNYAIIQYAMMFDSEDFAEAWSSR